VGGGQQTTSNKREFGKERLMRETRVDRDREIANVILPIVIIASSAFLAFAFLSLG
jgi:hypothetical protein